MYLSPFLQKKILEYIDDMAPKKPSVSMHIDPISETLIEMMSEFLAKNFDVLFFYSMSSNRRSLSVLSHSFYHAQLVRAFLERGNVNFASGDGGATIVIREEAGVADPYLVISAWGELVEPMSTFTSTVAK